MAIKLVWSNLSIYSAGTSWVCLKPEKKAPRTNPEDQNVQNYFILF